MQSGLPEPGGTRAPPPQFLADQLILSQSGADYAHHIPLEFSDLPTALRVTGSLFHVLDIKASFAG